MFLAKRTLSPCEDKLASLINESCKNSLMISKFELIIDSKSQKTSIEILNLKLKAKEVAICSLNRRFLNADLVVLCADFLSNFDF